MLYGDATRDLSCSLWNMLDGTSHNRDEEPSGIQVSACLLQTLLKKKKKVQKILQKFPYLRDALQITLECKQIKRKISINNYINPQY